MTRSARFFYYHKVLIFNLLFGGFIVLYPPELFDHISPEADFHYYAGVAILTALFFEFAGIWYKSRFIYSIKGAKEQSIPMLFRLAVWPRLLVSIFIIGLAFRAMGILESNDFYLLVLVLYAGIKEFWVRYRLLNPEDAEGVRDSQLKIWMAEAMLLIFTCVAYAAFWEYYLLDTPKVLLTAMSIQNFPIVGIVFFLFLVSVLMPHLLEEYLRQKPRSSKILAAVSFLLPISALLFQLLKMGYLDHS
jgi:hypothetical protein